MSQNKKFLAIFAIFIILPNLIFLYSGSLEDIFNGFNLNDNSFLLLVILSIPILAAFYIIFLNYIRKINSVLWYILSGILAIVQFLFLYSIYSLSNFGF